MSELNRLNLKWSKINVSVKNMSEESTDLIAVMTLKYSGEMSKLFFSAFIIKECHELK